MCSSRHRRHFINSFQLQKENGNLWLLFLAITFNFLIDVSVAQTPDISDAEKSDAKSVNSRISVSPTHIKKSGIQIGKPVKEKFSFQIALTGRVALNEEKLAHIFPVVAGQVDSVKVTLGDHVTKGDTLIAVHSREVGTAKLDLFQAKMNLELASLKLKLQQELAGNTTLLLESLRKQTEISEIQSQFSGRPMGDYREKLLQAYSNYVKSEADMQRLAGIGNSGAISSKQLAWAQATRNADLATFLSRIEQVEYELKTSLLQAIQMEQEATTRVAVCTSHLNIIGCREEDFENINPVLQKQSISDFLIRAPLSGTVISKDVVFGEQLRPDMQIMTIADLTTVWIEADIYEKDIPLLAALGGQTLKVRNAIWPNREFEAKIFYTGEIMNEKTRTISLRALAHNEKNLLKPGMFVKIEFESSPNDDPLLQVPNDAVIEHEGKQFVFIAVGDGQFERRDVVAGSRNAAMTVITQGIKDTDRVVTTGGFILKPKMLEVLLGGE